MIPKTQGTQEQAAEREHFDALADTTGESWWGHTTPAGRRRLARRADLITARLAELDCPEVLEIGCGTGALTEALLATAPVLAQITAVDLSPRSIELARARCGANGRVRFYTQDTTALAFASNRFDVVVGNSILHHVPLEPTLREVHRVLRGGGMAMFFEPNLMNPELAAEYYLIGACLRGRLQYSDDERPFVRWLLRRRFVEAGFTPVCVEPFDFLHPLVPEKMAPVVDVLGRVLECTPILRELSGSLRINAWKPISIRMPIRPRRRAVRGTSAAPGVCAPVLAGC
jgi:SAM-dependent methyltransferase